LCIAQTSVLKTRCIPHPTRGGCFFSPLRYFAQASLFSIQAMPLVVRLSLPSTTAAGLLFSMPCPDAELLQRSCQALCSSINESRSRTWVHSYLPALPKSA